MNHCDHGQLRRSFAPVLSYIPLIRSRTANVESRELRVQPGVNPLEQSLLLTRTNAPVSEPIGAAHRHSAFCGG